MLLVFLAVGTGVKTTPLWLGPGILGEPSDPLLSCWCVLILESHSEEQLTVSVEEGYSLPLPINNVTLGTYLTLVTPFYLTLVTPFHPLTVLGSLIFF
jgi:hypothetical protein